MTDLGTLETSPQNNDSFAYAISADGSTIVGLAERGPGGNFTGDRRAVLWDENNQIKDIGDYLFTGNYTGDTGLEPVSFFGVNTALDVSGNGNIVVGNTEVIVFRPGTNNTRLRTRAFLWDDTAEEMRLLPTLRADNTGLVYAWGVSDDGNFVVGAAYDENMRDRAYRFNVENDEMLDLGTLRSDNSGVSMAFGVSGDGSVVVGRAVSDGNGVRAFIWRTEMQDFENLMLSFPVLANDTEVAVAEQQGAVERLMGPNGMAARAGQSIISTRASAQHTGRNPTTVGARTTSLAALSYGYGVSDTFTLGATLSLSGSNMNNNAFDMGTGLGGAIWGEYSEGGAERRTGLQFSGALGYMRADGDIARGRLLDNVMLGTGSATIETRAVQATLGYGIQNESWLVTPSLGLAHYETTRDAYAEAGADFNASYDELRVNRTVATLGVTGEFDVSEQGRLSLGVGIDHELNPENIRLTGTSDIQGLATFDTESTFTANRTRPFATVGYDHDLGNGATVSGDLRVGRAVYGTTPSVGLGINYRMRF